MIRRFQKKTRTHKSQDVICYFPHCHPRVDRTSVKVVTNVRASENARAARRRLHEAEAQQPLKTDSRPRGNEARRTPTKHYVAVCTGKCEGDPSRAGRVRGARCRAISGAKVTESNVCASGATEKRGPGVSHRPHGTAVGPSRGGPPFAESDTARGRSHGRCRVLRMPAARCEHRLDPGISPS